jgi:cytoskeletal protein RodZ
MSEQFNETGPFLKTAREKQGLSLEMVHDVTKIPLDALRAIEEGYKVRTLSPFYYKSFVKSYAKYLGVDITAIATVAGGPLASPIESPEPVPVLRKVVPVQSPKTGSSKWLDLPVRSFDHGRSKKTMMAIVFVVLGAAALLSAIFLIRHVRASAPSAPVAQSKNKTMVPSSKKLDAPVKKEIKTASEPVKKVENAAPQAVKPVLSGVAVTVRPLMNAWVSVKVDGQSAHAGILKKGNPETWSGTKKIEVAGRDIDQLEFEINGKAIGKLGRRDPKARRVVVTSEGFTVEK